MKNNDDFAVSLLTFMCVVPSLAAWLICRLLSL